MRYLLDVNVLVAHGLFHHIFHSRVEAWLKVSENATLLTCAITELGFVRILSMPAMGAMPVSEAQQWLIELKQILRPAFEFVADTSDITALPAWVASPKQVTDGHLLALAQAQNAQLATLDARIPGAFLIP